MTQAMQADTTIPFVARVKQDAQKGFAELPSAEDIGRRINALRDVRDAMQELRIRFKDDVRSITQSEKVEVAAYAREVALRELLATIPAQTLGDVAAITLRAFELAEYSLSFVHEPFETKEHLEAIRRMMAACLPAICQAGDVDERTVPPGCREFAAGYMPSMAG